ncbi:hypothetical protein IKQ26_05120 [bacterium]|nr:hypothetical protein [bacterium]
MKELFLSIGQIFRISDSFAILISLCICVLWSIYFNWIKEKQKTEFQKQIEELKSKQDKLNYISKAQFEAEFNMYQELSEKSFEAVLKCSALFPIGFENIPIDEEAQLEVYQKKGNEAAEKLYTFQNLLYKYAPFIEESLYKQFDDIRLHIQKNVNLFPDYRLRNDIPKSVKIETECYERTQKIMDKQDILIKELRNYLKLLRVD